MRNNQIIKILQSKYNQDLAEKLLKSYLEIETNFFWKKWGTSELNAGHFVETMRRIIEFELYGTYTAFNQRLSNFSDQVITRYEQQTGHESFRMLIPRALKAIYNIRNKRGVGHIKDISPNEMDATYILYTTKWVLAETIRLATNLSLSDTQKLLDSIVERNIDILWKNNSLKRVLNPKIPSKEQILVLLYDESPLKAIQLQEIIEYKNLSNFTKILKELHKARFIEFDSTNCKISPTGILEAEKIIKKYKK